MRPDHPPQPHPEATIQAVLHFVRENHISAVHYFGLADKGLICALKAEPGVRLAITDYFNFWGSSSRFWGEDESEDAPIPEAPKWQDGVFWCQEGTGDAPMLIYDLSPSDGESVVEMIPRGQWGKGFDFVAVIGKAAPAFRRPLEKGWKWSRAGWFGVRTSRLSHP